MSLLSENVIPGDLGKIFSTNAKEKSDLERIKSRILSLKGIKEVTIDYDVFPVELTIYTSSLVKIKDIEDKVQITGFHAIPKNIFEL